MRTTNEKLNILKAKIDSGQQIKIMIIGLGSVGMYLLDYLVGLGDKRLHIIVAGRNADKIQSDVNIIKTAATIRGCFHSKISIEDGCDLDVIPSIVDVFQRVKPDIIVNTSRVYAGLKYGSISWSNIRAYGIWTPLAIRYARNIMLAYETSDSSAVSINTSYSDAVIPWLKSAGKQYFDFGSGNLNHLIPRMKFYIADKYGIDNLNEIDVTLAVSHFHDVVISKEGQTEGQDVLLDIQYEGVKLSFDKKELFAACKISMPSDQKRNMMNASSNFNIITSILYALSENKMVKVHTPGVNGEIGGYPFIVDCRTGSLQSNIDETVFSLDDMRLSNRKSIYLDGVENVERGCLYYTDELIDKTKQVFGVELPKIVSYDEIDNTSEFIVNNIIKRYK